MVKLHIGIPAIHKRYATAANLAVSAQKFVKTIIKGIVPDSEVRGSISALGSKSNIGLDDCFKGYPDIRNSIKYLADKKYGGNYPISVINSWINGSAGDARKKRPDDYYDEDYDNNDDNDDNDDRSNDCATFDINAEEPEDFYNYW